uniref:hypothetical protein n=1 Tax=Candidatus Electrothrix sp. TaxID=2170559 RepID=UPI004057545B
VKKSGSNILSHKLVSIDHGRMEFRLAMLSLFACFALILFGLAFVGYSFSDGQFNYKFIPQTLIGLAAMCAGAWMLYSGTSPRVFDKRKGAFWKGRKAPDATTRKNESPNYVRLENIYALQLISKVSKTPTHEGRHSVITRYEINLILKDSSRVHVVHHGNKKRIRQDAAVLAEFLDKPLWDASGVNMLKGIGKDFISKWSEIMEEYPSGDSEGVDMKRVMGYRSVICSKRRPD